MTEAKVKQRIPWCLSQETRKSDYFLHTHANTYIRNMIFFFQYFIKRFYSITCAAIVVIVVATADVIALA